mgnify:CR=1 FL=1
MALHECLIIKDNRILVLKNGNSWGLPSIELDDNDEVEAILKKNIKDNLGLIIEIIQVFNTYQIIKNDKNVNVNIFEANLLNGKLSSKNDFEASFFNIDELSKLETSETLKLVVNDL